jgi:2-alkyl-3-oxoalkanoate reductase
MKSIGDSYSRRCVMKIVVIGSTGVLASHVVPRLVERGHQVRTIVRRAEQVERLQRSGAEAVIGDIFEPGSLAEAAAGCEAALHLATAVPKAGQSMDWSTNDRIRREGTRNFLASCKDAGVQRYIQQSIALVYGEYGSEIVDESAALQPSPVAQSAVDMEAIVRESSLEWGILRGGMFYGPGTGREEEWRQATRDGALQLPGDGGELISLANVVDMARAVVLAVESAAPRSIYNVVDDEPVDDCTLFGYIAAQAGVPEPAPGGPVFLPSLGCSNARIKTELGWSPVYPTYRSGLALRVR